MQFYTDPARAREPHALPDAEVFHSTSYQSLDGDMELADGWYWWSCFPGCLPDGDPYGPFDNEKEAIADARDE